VEDSGVVERIREETATHEQKGRDERGVKRHRRYKLSNVMENHPN